MAELLISNDDLESLRDKVVVITGGSSGIGAAAAHLLLSIGAKVVLGDIQSPTNDPTDRGLVFRRTDVTKWEDLVQLFKLAKTLHGRIDHVFANAGVSSKVDYLALIVDEDGNPKEPDWACQDINLRGCINTAAIGMFHMKPENQGHGGSIVVTASIASFTHFRGVDYGRQADSDLQMRGMHALASAQGLPIRINAIAPSWTITGLVPEDFISRLGAKVQPPEDAARSALILMADESRNGQLMHSAGGRFKEVEQSIFVPAALEVTGQEGPSEDEIIGRALALMGNEHKDIS